MFYYVEFTPENVEIYKRKLQESELEICYNTAPNQPTLVAQQRILGDPLTYRKYLDVLPDKKDLKRKKCELQTDAQVVQFINNIYCVDDPNNHEAYQRKLVTTQEIFDIVNEYTTIFENKTILAFARWCSNNKTIFLRAKENRNASKRKRELYVMNDIYYDCMLTSITEYLPNYQQSLKTLQNDEFEIIGYARKSPTTDNLDTRVKLLELMINNLRSRSFATRIPSMPK